MWGVAESVGWQRGVCYGVGRWGGVDWPGQCRRCWVAEGVWHGVAERGGVG